MQQIGPQEADDIHAEFRQVMRAIAQRLDQAQYRLGMRRSGIRPPGRRRRNESRRNLERQYPVAQLVARWGVAERASQLAQERARAAAKDPALSEPQRAAAHQDAEIAKAHATAWERRAHAYGIDTDQLRGMLSEHEQRDAAPTSSSLATAAGAAAGGAAATSAAPVKDVFNTVGEDELHTYRQHQNSLDDAEGAPAASVAPAGGAIPDPPQAPGTAVTSSALSTATAAVAATLATEYVDEHLHFGPAQSHIDLDAVSGADLIDSAQVNADQGLDLNGVSPTVTTDLSTGQIENLDNITGMEL